MLRMTLGQQLYNLTYIRHTPSQIGRAFFIAVKTDIFVFVYYNGKRILVTLIEMLVVLLIISVLLLLFVPNLTKQKDSVTDTGNRAVVKVVESQAELYELNHQNEKASLSKLVAEGQITQKQAEAYRAHYVKNAGDHRAVAD